MDVYLYKRDLVEIKFEEGDFPLVIDALNAANDKLYEQHEKKYDRAEALVQKPVVGILAMLMLPWLYRYGEEEDLLDDLVSQLDAGERRISGHECRFVLDALIMGMTELARQREVLVNDMLATIHYRQLPTM